MDKRQNIQGLGYNLGPVFVTKFQTWASAQRTSDLIEKFLVYKRASHLADATIASYAAWLKPFAERYPALPATPEAIEGYLARLNPETSTPTNIWTALRMFYGFAAARFGVPDPMPQVARPRLKSKPVAHLTVEQAVKLIKTAEEDKRDRAMVCAFLGLGLRRIEGSRMVFRDIEERTILVRGKIKDERIPILSEIRDAFLALRDGRLDTEPVFLGRKGWPLRPGAFTEAIRRLFVRAGIEHEKPTPHTLRHSRGVLYLLAGGDAFSSKRMLRHSNLIMTDHYSQLITGELYVREESFNPLRYLKHLNNGGDSDQATLSDLGSVEPILRNCSDGFHHTANRCLKASTRSSTDTGYFRLNSQATLIGRSRLHGTHFHTRLRHTNTLAHTFRIILRGAGRERSPYV